MAFTDLELARYDLIKNKGIDEFFDGVLIANSFNIGLDNNKKHLDLLVQAIPFNVLHHFEEYEILHELKEFENHLNKITVN